MRLISTLLKLEILSFRRVEISKQANAKADDSNSYFFREGNFTMLSNINELLTNIEIHKFPIFKKYLTNLAQKI